MGKNTTFGRQSKIEMRPLLATNWELKIRTSYPKILNIYDEMQIKSMKIKIF